MTSWQLIITPKLSGEQNMQYDLKMFDDFEKDNISSTLRIHSWKPKCISYGYSQKMDSLLDCKLARKQGWDIVKRPTGGGIVFHNEAEVTYSLVTAIDNPKLPKGLVPSYAKISEAVVYALKSVGVKARIARIQNTEHRTQNTGLCFSYPAEYEIVVDGKKIVGSAQKRGKRALLQQGSIFVRNTANGGEQGGVSVKEILGRKVAFDELSSALINGFKVELGIEFNDE